MSGAPTAAVARRMARFALALGGFSAGIGSVCAASAITKRSCSTALARSSLAHSELAACFIGQAGAPLEEWALRRPRRCAIGDRRRRAVPLDVHAHLRERITGLVDTDDLLAIFEASFVGWAALLDAGDHVGVA